MFSDKLVCHKHVSNVFIKCLLMFNIFKSFLERITGVYHRVVDLRVSNNLLVFDSLIIFYCISFQSKYILFYFMFEFCSLVKKYI